MGWWCFCLQQVETKDTAHYPTCTGQLPPQRMIQPKVNKPYYRFMEMWFKQLEHGAPSFHRGTKYFVSKINPLLDSSWKGNVGLNEVHWRSTRGLRVRLKSCSLLMALKCIHLEPVCRNTSGVSV